MIGSSVSLPGGGAMPTYGLGTWRMGERERERKAETDAIRLGLDLGFAMIDTAEMYGDGGAEEIVGAAIKGRRERPFIVSKVLPGNASRAGTIAACERSLKRLGVDCLDLYLLHWPGAHPLSATVEAFETLVRDGKIKRWGVSNFDVDDMQKMSSLAAGKNCATNQVLYNLARRGIEHDLAPWCAKRKIPIMAYSPVDQGRLLGHPTLKTVAKKLDATPAQLALAWLLRQDNMIVIPKATDPRHVEDNAAAAALSIPREQLGELDAAFPPPKGRKPLEML
jgi:diketogulonate reductase-like aldo/keto reductase